VNVYLDTSIVIADTALIHPHKANVLELFRKIRVSRWTPVIAAHGLAEAYSVLTRTPFQPRITSADAWRSLQQNVLGSFEIISLSRTDYSDVLRHCAAEGWTGGMIFDALHMQAARKTKCARVYTLNVAHFRRIAPDLGDRILSP
jgi:predicted nucleic acid-binding protein